MHMRNIVLAVVLWCFAMSTTLLLLSLWGRSVAHDQPAVTRAAASVSARALSAQVAGWLAGVAGNGSPAIGEAMDQVLRSDPGRRALEGLTGQLLATAELEPGTEVAIDPRPHLRPLVPLLAERLEARGLAVEESALSATVESIDPVVVRAGPGAPLGGSLAEARRILKLATLAALAALASFGSTALWLAEDRRRMLRHLAHRVTLAGLGFAVFLQLGSWAMDPGRGAAEASGTLREVAAALLGSSLQVPLVVALAGAAVALAARRWRAPDVPVDIEGHLTYSRAP